MTIVKQLRLIVVVFILINVLTGCVQKTTKYEQVKFDFQKITTKGAYIEFQSQGEHNATAVRNICSPSMVELNNVWLGVEEFYIWQIDEYSDKVKDTNTSGSDTKWSWIW